MKVFWYVVIVITIHKNPTGILMKAFWYVVILIPIFWKLLEKPMMSDCSTLAGFKGKKYIVYLCVRIKCNFWGGSAEGTLVF